MNYIELINQFWRIRRSKRITSTQSDLYFCLLQESNEREWENPFEFPNTSICARIGISEPTLIDARARLKQLGLIDFESGIRKTKSPVYEILNLKDLSKTLSKNRVKTEQEPSITGNIITKQNETETKQENNNNSFLISIFDFMEKFKNHSWLEMVGMNYKVPPDKIKEYFAEFCNEQQIKQVELKPENEFTNHFVNWLKINIKKEKSSAKKEKEPVSKYRKAIEAIEGAQKIREEWANGNG